MEVNVGLPSVDAVIAVLDFAYTLLYPLFLIIPNSFKNSILILGFLVLGVAVLEFAQ